MHIKRARGFGWSSAKHAPETSPTGAKRKGYPKTGRTAAIVACSCKIYQTYPPPPPPATPSSLHGDMGTGQHVCLISARPGGAPGRTVTNTNASGYDSSSFRPPFHQRSAPSPSSSSSSSPSSSSPAPKLSAHTHRTRIDKNSNYSPTLQHQPHTNTHTQSRISYSNSGQHAAAKGRGRKGEGTVRAGVWVWAGTVDRWLFRGMTSSGQPDCLFIHRNRALGNGIE